MTNKKLPFTTRKPNIYKWEKSLPTDQYNVRNTKFKIVDAIVWYSSLDGINADAHVEVWVVSFAPQVPLCNPQKFPYTDVIIADEHLSDKLRELSAKLGVQHPKEDKQTRSHGTGAKKKLVSIFKDQPELIQRLLVLFKEDCDMYPEICDVSELYKAIGFEK